ncbi:UNVERIFIED_CONTAM: hypothetical protein RMT77_006668 [Armadillidium vulgare]
MTLAFAVKSKTLAKRDKDREDQALKWVKDVTGLSVPDDVDYVEALKDGQLLCTLMNKLVPGSVRKIHTAGPDFKMIENINGFIKGAKDYGVAMNDVFVVTDLWEEKDIAKVTDTIYHLARLVHKHPDFKGPFLVPKPAT